MAASSALSCSAATRGVNIPRTLERMRPLLRHTLTWARRLFLPLALGFIAYSAYRASGSLRPLLASIAVPNLALACVCWFVAQWSGPLSTTALARVFGIPLGYRKLASISILRIPAKYLPGGIWQSVARFTAYREHAVKGSDSFAILLIEHVLALGISTFLGSLLMFASQGAPLSREIALGLMTVGLALLVLPTVWMTRSRPAQQISGTAMLMAITAVILFWCVAGTAFLLYWSALFRLPLAETSTVLSGYLLSWAAGFAAVFAPQGVGVFEWTAAHLLPARLPLSVTVTALAGFRIVTIIGDLLAWMLGLVMQRAENGAVV